MTDFVQAVSEREAERVPCPKCSHPARFHEIFKDALWYNSKSDWIGCMICTVQFNRNPWLCMEVPDAE